MDWEDPTAKPPPEHAMIEFHLTNASFMARHERARQSLPDISLSSNCIPYARAPMSASTIRALQECYNAHQAFLRYHNHSSDNVLPQDESVVCTVCGGILVRVEDSAINVCTACGFQVRYHFASDGGLTYEARQAVAPTAYKYDPRAYFRKCLDEVQGLHRGAFPRWLIRELTADFSYRRMMTSHITPDDVLDALRRIRAPRYYPCRWALTKKLNPSFILPEFSYSFLAHLEQIFQDILTHYSGIVHELQLNRKNLPSYPYLIHEILIHLHHSHDAVFFKPLKCPLRQKYQHRLIHCILHHILPDLPSRTTTTTTPSPPPLRPIDPVSTPPRRTLPPSPTSPVFAFTRRDRRILDALKRPRRQGTVNIQHAMS